MKNLGKTRHTWKNASQLVNYATLRKMRHTCKNVPNLKNWVLLGKCGTLEKCVTVVKMR